MKVGLIGIPEGGHVGGRILFSAIPGVVWNFDWDFIVKRGDFE